MDVAKVAGVDLSTVSRLLRDDRAASYRPETRARVIAAAEELGYRVNAQARALRLGRQDSIAMLVPDLDNFGFTAVLRGVQEACEEAGVTLLISEIGSSAPERIDRLAALAGRVDGVLVAHAESSDTALQAWLDDIRLPSVFVQRGIPGASASVLFDEENNAAAMVDHLVGLGHRDIAHVSGALSTDTAQRRKVGFDAALAAHGLSLGRGRRADGGWSIEGGHAAAATLISGRRRPTALAVDSLVQAIGALSALHEKGLSIPDDVSVIAIDEHPLAAHTTPPLTTVYLDQRELGRQAATALLDWVDDTPAHDVIVASPSDIIDRGSTAALA
ncbi:LacI family DNA-binding transcriptional regulator [Pseudactinotalea sp.]|uniref:LacI family DNA-binding transcriptional regulator n=1 Tax=Pseudactinotalea sp. TaxID=1926260 RepID=UPI003B3AE4D4